VERATEVALRLRIPQADVIHLATHGYFNPTRPMSSGVLLTPPPTGSGVERLPPQLAKKTPPHPRSDDVPSEGSQLESNDDGALQAWEIYTQLKLKAELVVLSACETGRGQTVRGEGIIGLTRALQYAGARSIVASQWKVADDST
jgi:CHAT domain-containing protein